MKTIGSDGSTMLNDLWHRLQGDVKRVVYLELKLNEEL